jgi:hypothetical protein
VAEAVQWYVDLALVHRVMPVRETGDEYFEQMHALVADGRATVWTDLLDHLEHRPESIEDSFPVGVTSFPLGGEASNPMSMFGYLMSAGTTHPQESWRWLSYLTRQRIAGPGGEGVGVPSRRSVAEQSLYWERPVRRGGRAVPGAGVDPGRVSGPRAGAGGGERRRKGVRFCPARRARGWAANVCSAARGAVV